MLATQLNKEIHREFKKPVNFNNTIEAQHLFSYEQIDIHDMQYKYCDRKLVDYYYKHKDDMSEKKLQKEILKGKKYMDQRQLNNAKQVMDHLMPGWEEMMKPTKLGKFLETTWGKFIAFLSSALVILGIVFFIVSTYVQFQTLQDDVATINEKLMPKTKVVQEIDYIKENMVTKTDMIEFFNHLYENGAIDPSVGLNGAFKGE